MPQHPVNPELLRISAAKLQKSFQNSTIFLKKFLNKALRLFRGVNAQVKLS